MADGEQDRSSTVPRLHPVPLMDEGAAGGTIDEPEEPDLASLVERAYLIAVGLASLTATATIDAVARSVDPAISEEEGHSLGLPVMAGAAIGAAAQAGALAVRAGVTAARTAGGLASVVVGSLVGADRTRWLQHRLAGVDGRGQRERDEAELAATSFADVILPAIVDAVADHLDLTALVADRVDLDAVVVRLDVDRVVDRVDLRRAIDRISIDEIAAKLDVDAVAARLDIQAVVDRLDVVGIAQGVIDELDIPELIRESTGAMSAETVDTIRLRGMDADRFISRVMDRVLSRKGDDGPPPAPDGAGGRP
ncbi:MAG: hypothetical protein ACXVEI_08585 [Actinomycetota bacterium]